jgi:hypothetical protein
MIIKNEEYSDISLMVGDDFDEEWDSPILKCVLKDLPIESRRTYIKSE